MPQKHIAFHYARRRYRELAWRDRVVKQFKESFVKSESYMQGWGMARFSIKQSSRSLLPETLLEVDVGIPNVPGGRKKNLTIAQP